MSMLPLLLLLLLRLKSITCECVLFIIIEYFCFESAQFMHLSLDPYGFIRLLVCSPVLVATVVVAVFVYRVCLFFYFSSSSVAFWYTSKTITTRAKQSQGMCLLHTHTRVYGGKNHRKNGMEWMWILEFICSIQCELSFALTMFVESCVCVFSKAMLSIWFYWGPEFKLNSQNTYECTYMYNLDDVDDGKQEKDSEKNVKSLTETSILLARNVDK